MGKIMRFYRIPLRISFTIAILVVYLGQPKLVTGLGERASERTASQTSPIPAVVYVSTDGHIHELALKDGWQHRDLTEAAAAPLASPYRAMAFQRSDGVSMVVYRAADLNIHSLYLEMKKQDNTWQEVWHHADLSDIAGAPDAGSDPFGYVRNDGINAVVYAGVDEHIHELRLEGTWIHADLTIMPDPDAPNTYIDERPFAYDRGDGINAIVYEWPGCICGRPPHIIELRLDSTGWDWADLTAISIPQAPIASSEFTAYVRSDGIPTINYRGIDSHIHDLRLETAWYHYDLTDATGAGDAYEGSAPYGYVRSDGINAIVYAAGVFSDLHIYEFYLQNTWHHYELTSIPNAKLGGYPIGYVRSDGLNAVVYRGMNDHILEIRLERDGWQWADLTFLAGEISGGTNPWPYNRSGVNSAYLPLIIR